MIDVETEESTPSSESPAMRPRVLLVYYTYTQQSKLVADAMAGALRERGCDVSEASIGFTDKRWSERFTRRPLRHAWLEVFAMLPAQLRGATGEIEIPDVARQGDYDLVCIGGPTWFFRQSIPIRSFLRSDEAARLLEGTRFGAFVVCRRYYGLSGDLADWGWIYQTENNGTWVNASIPPGNNGDITG